MQKTKPVPSDFHVVTMISNPRRYRSRYDLYHQFAKHIIDSGAKLHTVEVAFGDRPFELVTQGEDILRLRMTDELFIKENAINVGFRRMLPDNWQYAGWFDADIHFARHDWVAETVHGLQHHSVLQPWSMAHDLSPAYETFHNYRSFGWCYQQLISRYSDKTKIPPLVVGKSTTNYSGEVCWHPGFAWAIRRDAYETVGGLLDWVVTGAGDWHMSYGLIGRMADTASPEYTQAFRDKLMLWQRNAAKLKGSFGYIDGTITHNWHGKKSLRSYNDRWEILTRNQFDPNIDLVLDANGLYQLTDEKPQMRDDFAHYFARRNEDGVDMD